MLAPLLVALVLAADAPPEAPAPQKRVLIAVPDLVPLGVSAQMAQNLTAVIAAELGRYDNVRAISGREIAVVLGMERQKSLVGCEDDSCMSSVADALGAEKVLSGQIGTIEESVVFTLQLTDVRAARVDGRVVKVVPVGKNQIIDAVRGAITELMGKATSRNQPPRLAVTRSVVAHQGERVELDASRSYDPDGDPLATEWRQVDGPPALLETTPAGLAGFTAAEVGHYVFQVSVTDGRSPPIEHPVQVEVLKNRPLQVGLGLALFGPFNRYIDTDGVGGIFRNRTPLGPKLDLGLWLSDRWQLIGGAEILYMKTWTEDENRQNFEYLSFNLVAGIRRYFGFGVFNLFAEATAGSARLFFVIKQNGVARSPGAQAILGEVRGGVDVPLGERVGLMLHVGVRAQANTEPLPAYPNVTFVFSPWGFFWGIQGAAAAYARF